MQDLRVAQDSLAYLEGTVWQYIQLFAYYRQAMTWWKEGGQREDGCKRPEHISNLRSVADGLAAQPTGESSHPFEQSTKLVFIPGAHSGEDRREAMKRNLRQVWLRTQVMRFGPLITSPLGLMDKASDF